MSTSFSFVESFKKLRNLLEHEHRRHGAKVFLITSVLENEGKSTVAANLALSLAKTSKKVLLVDADLRKPAQYKILERRGLETAEFSDVLAGDAPLSDAVHFDKEYGIYTIFNQSTERDSTELLRRKQTVRILQALREKMDYIILDSAPVSMVADAELLAEYADAVLLTVRQDYARTADINDAIDPIEHRSYADAWAAFTIWRREAPFYCSESAEDMPDIITADIMGTTVMPNERIAVPRES